LRASSSAASGERCYTVAMDKDGHDATAPTFAAEEIKADV
jgi:hypothetical protein